MKTLGFAGRLSLALLAMLSIATLISGSAKAQVPTIDVASVTQLTQLYLQGQNAITGLNNIKNVQSGISQATGLAGQFPIDPTVKNLFGSATTLANGRPNPSNTYGMLQQLAPGVGHLIDDPTTKGPPPGQSSWTPPADFHNVAQTGQWTEQTYYAPRPLSSSDQAAYQSYRASMARDSSVGGYGLALSTKAALNDSPGKTAALEQQVESAPDIRGDIKANTTVLIAERQQLDTQTALLAKLVDMESSHAIANDSVYTQNGVATPTSPQSNN